MGYDFKIVELEAQTALAIKEEVSNQEIGKKMGEFFGELMAFSQKKVIQMSGPPFALYHSWNDQKTVMEVGFPAPASVKGEGRIKPISLPGGRVVTGFHIGPYNRLMESYQKMQDWMTKQGVKPANKMWEVYLTDPEKEKDPAKYVTQLFWPIEP